MKKAVAVQYAEAPAAIPERYELSSPPPLVLSHGFLDNVPGIDHRCWLGDRMRFQMVWLAHPWLRELLLWYNVLSLGIWFGGTIYQMLVVVPLWSADAPASVRSFFTTSGYTRTISNFFGRRTQALRAIPLFLLTAVGWPDPTLRIWLALPSLCMIGALVLTLGYIYRINEVLVFQAGAGLNANAIRDLVRRWIFADRIRLAIMSLGYVSLLYAFRIAG